LIAAAACGPSGGGKGTCKDSIGVGDLVITEVFADFKAPAGGTGADEGKEWFEVYNASDRPIELEGVRVDHSRPDGSKLKSHTMAAVTLAPGQYFTLGNSTPDLVPPYVDYGYSADLGDFFNTDGGKLALSCGDSEIDSAQYDSVKEGHSRELTSATFPDYTLNDDLANWCQGNDTEFENSNFGTPGSDNDCVPIIIGACNDNGTMRDVVSPMAGELVISEVMPNPAVVSDTVGEWFEITALADVDLNGIAPDRAGDSSAPKALDSPDCIHLASGDRAIFAKSADAGMNGGLPAPVIGTFTFALVDGSVATPADVQVVAGTTVIDAITWTSTRSGKSHSLDPLKIDAITNDDETNFCDATSTYGADGNLGTPLAANDSCPLVVPAGMCDDGGTIRNIVTPTAGQLVISEIHPHPTAPQASREWFEIANVGGSDFDLNGLGLDRAGDTTKPNVITSTTCKVVPAGGFALFARNGDTNTNGMLPAADATFGFSMVDSNGDCRVLDCTVAGSCDTATPTGPVLDSVAWATKYGGGVSSSTVGASSQLDGTLATGSTFPDAWCLATTTYGDGLDKGTPKAANVCQ